MKESTDRRISPFEASLLERELEDVREGECKVGRIERRLKEDRVWFLDPKEGFQKKELTIEVREDPLTGHHSRILPFRRRFPDASIPHDLIEASRKGCPFCPEQIETLTPRLVPEIAVEGRIRKGRAVLFPNSFPYAKHNWVVALTEDHFLQIDRFTPEILRDGFEAVSEGISRLEKICPEDQYASVNCNYLLQAGAGVLHPHLQVVVQEEPTVKHRAVLEGLKTYHREKGAFFWEDYLLEEKGAGERYIGKIGETHFCSSFSPLGILGEILVLFEGRENLSDLSAKNWSDFSEGLVRIFKYLIDTRTYSFNLSLFSGTWEGVRNWVYGRLCPRTTMPPWGTSDINYFEKLHGEVICVLSPETLAKEIQPYFE